MEEILGLVVECQREMCQLVSYHMFSQHYNFHSSFVFVEISGAKAGRINDGVDDWWQEGGTRAIIIGIIRDKSAPCAESL